MNKLKAKSGFLSHRTSEKVSRLSILKIIGTRYQSWAWLSLRLYCRLTSSTFTPVVCYGATQPLNSLIPFFTLTNTLLIGNIVFFKYITQTHFFYTF